MTALNPANGQSTIRDNTGGMAIKGASSGPFVIVGNNFAPGTTAADIQSALEPIAGSILNCWIISQYPTVSAEITFAERWSAENTIANFHNQKVSNIQPSYNAIQLEANKIQRPTVGSFPCVGSLLAPVRTTVAIILRRPSTTTSANMSIDNVVVAVRSLRFGTEVMSLVKEVDSIATR